MRKGFTLIELIAVIVILGIIALIAVGSALNIFTKSKESLYNTQKEIIESAAKKWIIANNNYIPSDGSNYELTLSTLVTEGYLDDGDIEDPRTGDNINAYVNVYFDSASNQYKAKLIDTDAEFAAQETILNASTVVTSGTGLYNDEDVAGRYYFKGSNPNNYIKFNNEIWRIVSIESDGKIKIVKQDGFLKVYDETGKRTSSNGNTACTSQAGCPIWAGNKNNVVQDSTLKSYLNSDYYNQLNKKAKESITSGTWCYKYLTIPNNNTSSEFREDELNNFCETEKVSDRIGILSVKEVIDSSIGTCGFKITCQNTYLNISKKYWLLNYNATSLILNASGQIVSNNSNDSSVYVKPVVYLDSSTLLTGKGTSSSPFKIK
jgi:type IV pilus assembly protein PilA